MGRDVSENIKQFVRRRLAAGDDLDTVWAAAREQFPHRCPGWNYITSINRTLRKEHTNGLQIPARQDDLGGCHQ
jgi:hypothetical protein